MSSSLARPPRRYGRQALWVCVVAFLIHLVPLFWLNETPESRLSRAEATGDLILRAEILRPLEGDERATPSELRRGATLLLELGASGDARFLAEEAVRRQPGTFANQLLLARIFAAERMPQALSRAVKRASELKPEEVEPALILARYLEKEGELGRAIATLREAHGAHPGADEVTLMLARLLTETDALADAEALLTSSGVNTARHTLALGILRHRQGRGAEALVSLTRALEGDENLGEAHYFLGIILWEQGNLRGAEEAFRKAERRAREDHRPLAAICAIQAQTGRREAARATGMDFRRRFPTHYGQLHTTCRGG